MQGLASFCVFGGDREHVYYQGAIKNADLYQAYYPNVTCKFFLGQTAAQTIGETLGARPNVEVVVMDEPEDQTSTYWRFLALKDTGYDFYIFRDVDGRPLPRERTAVEEWLESPYEFHVMRDHPRHGREMLAGLWGVKALGARRIAPRLPSRVYGDYYQVDQDFLTSRVWRYARSSLLQHVGCRWTFRARGEVRDFSYDRTCWDYVGESRKGDETLRFPEHRAEVMLDPWVLERLKSPHVPLQNPAEVQPPRARRDLRRTTRPHPLA